jgi:hypothetical protein
LASVLRERNGGLKVFAQDITYLKGDSHDRIGGSAHELPLPNGSVDVMTLHCTFEHFEGLVDSQFICEAGRVLSSSGRVCILPLYVARQYTIVRNPFNEMFTRRIDNTERTYWVWSQRYGASHGRFYDIQTLRKRVIDVAEKCGLNVALYRVSNIKEITRAVSGLDLPGNYKGIYCFFALLLYRSGFEPMLQ